MLIGNLPDFAEQVAFNGPPLLLSADEVAFIRSRSICPILDDSPAFPLPSSELVDQFAHSRAQYVKTASEEYAKARQENLEKFRVAKTKRDGSKGETSAPAADGRGSTSKNTGVAAFEPTVLIPLMLPQELSSGRRESLAEVDRLPYPATAFEVLRCRVFADLWDKGLYVQPDSRFKCDFLVYEGAALLRCSRSFSHTRQIRRSTDCPRGIRGYLLLVGPLYRSVRGRRAHTPRNHDSQTCCGRFRQPR